MIDAPRALREHLLADANVVAQCGDRVWADTDTPAPGYKPSDGGAIVFTFRGGIPDYSDALLVPSVQFKCYGGSSPYDAQETYRVLYDAMQNTAGAEVRHARCEVIGQSLSEPDSGWPFVLTYFKVWIGNP